MGCIESYKEREEFVMPNIFLKKTISIFSIFSSDDQFNDIDLDYQEEFDVPLKNANDSQYLECQSALMTAPSFHKSQKEMAFLITSPRLQK